MTIEQASAFPPPSSGSATMTGQFGLSELHKGDVLAGRFRIENMLGIGGFGIVYRARDLSLDIDVALKVLRPELARRPESFERFRQELLLARQVSSAHVVRIHDIAQHDGRWFISMDFVAGQSLEQRLNDAGKLPTDEAVKIIQGLLAGLAAAHQRGVIHRDLKPANILLDGDGQAVITDFGVARSLGATGMTQSGIVVGTPEYLSPEQARGDSVDARSDLYSVGLMLHEILTGSLPFSGGTPAEMVMQRIIRPVPSLSRARPDLPHWLHAFSDRLLKINPGHRFASSNEALRAIEQKRVPRPPLNRRLLLVAALVLVLIGAVGIKFWQRVPMPGSVPASIVSTPRIALLPLRIVGDDPDLAGVARAFDEHLQNWIRADSTHALAPRRRVLDAIARAAPGMQGEAMLRQLPEIARAANATQILQGELHHDASGWILKLDLWTAAGKTPIPGISAHAGDVASLFADYVNELPSLLIAADIKRTEPPTLPATSIAVIGRALIALDQHRAVAAAGELDALGKKYPENTIVTDALLRAQDDAQQALAAQATRDRIVKQFAQDNSAPGYELYSRALIGNEQNEAVRQTLAKALQNFPLDVALIMLDAQTLSDSGEGAKALGVLRRYVDSDDQDAHALYLLGRTAIEQGEAQTAVDDYLLRALVLDTRAGDSAAEAETRNALGVGYERLGQLDAAAEQYNRAATMREKLGDDEGLAKSLRNLAIVQAVRGDNVAADRSLDRVKKLLESRGDQASLADLYNDRGVVAEERSDYSEAMKFYRQALAVRQQLSLPSPIAESLNNVAFCFFSLGDFDNALVYWQQALTQYKKLDDRSKQLHIEESIGLLDIARGRFKAAGERLTTALQAAQDHQLPEEEAVAHTYLAELAVVEGRYADALTAVDHAEQVFARRSDQRGQAEALLIRARIWLALGDAAIAQKAISAIDVAHISTEQHVAFLLARSRIAKLAGDTKAALSTLDEASKITANSHSALGIQIQLERARLALLRNELPDAAKILGELGEDAARLPEIPLRLQWLELQMATALRAGKSAEAIARYREALNMLKVSGQWADASLLHELGARAFVSSAGDAALARAAADGAVRQELAAAPSAARESLQLELARRLREELGNDHAS